MPIKNLFTITPEERNAIYTKCCNSTDTNFSLSSQQQNYAFFYSGIIFLKSPKGQQITLLTNVCTLRLPTDCTSSKYRFKLKLPKYFHLNLMIFVLNFSLLTAVFSNQINMLARGKIYRKR